MPTGEWRAVKPHKFTGRSEAWYRARFGTERSGVQIPAPRLPSLTFSSTDQAPFVATGSSSGSSVVNSAMTMRSPVSARQSQGDEERGARQSGARPEDVAVRPGHRLL